MVDILHQHHLPIGGGSDDTSWSDGTVELISGSAVSTGSFGKLGINQPSPAY